MRFAFPTLAAFFFFLVQSSARLTNVTIDDTEGDPTNGRQIMYAPGTAWQPGNGCGPCTAKPTPESDAYLGTWHDATFNPNDTAVNSAVGQIISAAVEFTGTAVYVNCIVTGSSVSPDGNTDMTFFLDGTRVGIFQKSPNGDKTYDFNTIVYAISGLSNTQHTINLTAGLAGQKALVLLDSIMYTVDDGSEDATSTAASGTPDNTSTSQIEIKKKTNISVIVGSLVAALVVVTALVIALFVYYLRKRRREKDISTADIYVVSPFEQDDQHSRPSIPQSASYQDARTRSSSTNHHTASSTLARVSKSTRYFSEKRRAMRLDVAGRQQSRPLPRVSGHDTRGGLTTSTPSEPSQVGPPRYKP